MTKQANNLHLPHHKHGTGAHSRNMTGDPQTSFFFCSSGTEQNTPVAKPPPASPPTTEDFRCESVPQERKLETKQKNDGYRK